MAVTQVQPYLFYGGRCEEAIAFYERAVGARRDMLMRFSDSPDPVPPGMLAPGFEKKVMHASFFIGEQMILACDGGNEEERSRGVSLALTVTTEAEVDRLFDALVADGGQATMPPGPTFWSKRFAMGTDRFGIGWMVMVADAPGA